MKRILFIGFAMISLAACKKSDSSTNNNTTTTPQNSYAKMKVNGVLVELSYTPLWTYESSPKIYGFGITENVTGTSRRMLSFRIQETDLTTGVAHNIGVGYSNEIIYLANQGSLSGQYKANKSFSKSHGTFTLTKIKDLDGTRKAFYGTFSGTLVNSSGDSVVITEGQIIEQ